MLKCAFLCSDETQMNSNLIIWHDGFQFHHVIFFLVKLFKFCHVIGECRNLISRQVQHCFSKSVEEIGEVSYLVHLLIYTPLEMHITRDNHLFSQNVERACHLAIYGINIFVYYFVSDCIWAHENSQRSKGYYASSFCLIWFTMGGSCMCTDTTKQEPHTVVN